MALKDVIREKTRQNASLLAVIGGSSASTIMEAIQETGRKCRVYDFGCFGLKTLPPEFSTDGAEVLFINRIDQAPPSFIITFMKAISTDEVLRGMSVIISAAGKGSGLPAAIEREFSIIRTGGH
jgi:hypothetical protein